MSRALVVPVPVAQNAVCEVLARLFDARDRLVLAVYDRPNCPMLRAALEEIREAIARGRDANREIDAVAVAA
jgi:DNA-binding transcriptional regulator LsrR (DeoR family)